MLTQFNSQILPLYILIMLGWICGKTKGVKTSSIADLIIFFITPFVFFGSICKLELSSAHFLLFGITWIPSILSLWIMKRFTFFYLSDDESRIVASSSAVSNGGYFGIPLYVCFFGDSHLGEWMLLVIGSTLFEITISYYQLARANFSIRNSVYKLLKLPVLWAAILGILYSWSKFPLPILLEDLHREFRGAYMVIGMMLIGLSLTEFTFKNSSVKAIQFGLLGRLIVYPILTTALLLLEHRFLNVLDPSMRQAALLFGFLPTAANTIAYAVQVGLSGGITGSIVFATTILSGIFVPLIFPWAQAVLG